VEFIFLCFEGIATSFKPRLFGDVHGFHQFIHENIIIIIRIARFLVSRACEFTAAIPYGTLSIIQLNTVNKAPLNKAAEKILLRADSLLGNGHETTPVARIAHS
jgi:hypothetical protein